MDPIFMENLHFFICSFGRSCAWDKKIYCCAWKSHIISLGPLSLRLWAPKLVLYSHRNMLLLILILIQINLDSKYQLLRNFSLSSHSKFFARKLSNFSFCGPLYIHWFYMMRYSGKHWNWKSLFNLQKMRSGRSDPRMKFCGELGVCYRLHAARPTASPDLSVTAPGPHKF